MDNWLKTGTIANSTERGKRKKNRKSKTNSKAADIVAAFIAQVLRN